MNEPDTWVNLIGNFGFPIALTAYLLVRFENKIDHLSGVIENLRDEIKQNSKNRK